MFEQLFSILAPVFICILIGYFWARWKIPFETKFVSNIVMFVATPCLLLDIFNRVRIEADVFAEIALAAVVSFSLIGLIGSLVLKAFRYKISDFLPTLIFPNTGNMGLPITQYAFGEVGLALSSVVFTISTISIFAVGPSLNKGRVDIRELARMPLIYAVVFCVFMLALDFHLPQWMGRTVALIGGLTFPLMLFALGIALCNLRITHMGRALVLTFLRLGIGLGVAVGVGFSFDLDPMAASVLILQSSMPIAIYSYLLAERYGEHGEEIAGAVMLSTLASIIFLPIILWFLLQYA